jgi:hypothetical protein
MDSKVTIRLNYILTNTAINWPTIFYRPILAHLESNDIDKVTEVVRLTSYLNDVMGETNFWFGLETKADTFTSYGTKGIDSVPNSSMDISMMSSNNIKAARPASRFFASSSLMDLIGIIIIGKSNLTAVTEYAKGTVASTEGKELTCSVCQMALIMELIWSLRRLRLASRHVINYFQ